MRKAFLLGLISTAALAAGTSAQQNALQTAASTLGATTVSALQFTGSGRNFSVGQNYSPSEPWPAVIVKSYTAQANFTQGSMRIDMTREQTNREMPRGGGAPIFGEQRQTALVSGNYAWNVPAPAPNAPAGMAQANPGAQPERMLALWSLPQGFIKAALANSATMKPVKTGTEVAFTVGGKYKMVGTINGMGQVEKVLTWIDHPIVGDMPIETTYSDYKDFGGIMFPSHIVQTQDGYPALDLTITAVMANPAFDAPVPDNVPKFQPPPTVVTVDKLADGVWYLTGTSHHSAVIEMKDHFVILDVPLGEERAKAVVAKAKELVPNKPFRYLITSHHHWDHLGGIRTAMDEGATIVTYQGNKSFLERVAKTTHTLVPDAQSRSKKGVKIKTVGDDDKLTDGTRVIEIHRLMNYTHTGDMTVVYLPTEKVLFEPDAFTPPPMAGTALIPPAQAFAKALYDNIQRLKLDVQTIAPLHGNRKTDVAELSKASGVTATN